MNVRVRWAKAAAARFLEPQQMNKINLLRQRRKQKEQERGGVGEASRVRVGLGTRPSTQLKGWAGAWRRCNFMHPPRDP